MSRLWPNRWRLSLRWQLMLAVALVHAVLMSVFVWDMTVRQQRLLLQVQTAEAQAIAQAMSTSAAGWLAARDIAGLQEIAEIQRGHPELLFAMILDQQGQVLAHSDRSRLGQYVRDMPEVPVSRVMASNESLVDVVTPVVLASRQLGWIRVGLGQRQARAHLDGNTRDGMLYAIAAIAIGTVLAALLGIQLTRRLHEIQLVTGEIRAGRRDARVPYSGNDEIGKLTADFNAMLDTLAQREADIRLQTGALEAAANMIFITDREGVILWANSSFLQHTGYSAKEAFAHRPGELLRSGLHPADFYRKLWETVLVGRVWQGEMVNRRKDGSLYDVETVITPLRNESGEITHFVSVNQDITARRAAAAALEESERRFRSVVETINEVFWIMDADRERMLYISPGYGKIWDRPHETLLTSLDGWYEAMHPDDRARLRAMQTQLRSGPQEEKFRIRRPDGEERWIRSRTFPVREKGGGVRQIVGVAADITDENVLREQFLRAQRMEAVGTLAGGIAHDLNNILTPMTLVTGLLRPSLTDPKDRQALEMIESSAKRGSALVRQLLGFSRGLPSERVVLQPRHLLKEMRQVMEETFPRSIEIRDSIPASLWCVRADPTQVHQVLMNLCVNARDAMPDGGRLTLAARNEQVDAMAATRDAALKPGNYLVISVSDTGEGIPNDIQVRIFEPFFTTKPRGRGTGLGLTTVLTIVRGHDGAVLMSSEVGRGSEFQIYLPAEPELNVPVAEAATENVPRGKGDVVLVVDDEAPIREATKLMLEPHGYRVLTAPHGQAALEVVKASGTAVQLIITDVMMPVMDGVVFVRNLRRIRPMKIIAVTGLEETARSEELRALGVDEIVCKPFTAVTLLRHVARLLEKT